MNFAHVKIQKRGHDFLTFQYMLKPIFNWNNLNTYYTHKYHLNELLLLGL